MIRINSDNPDLIFGIPDAGGGETYFYQGQPFTGIIEDYFYDNPSVLAGETQVVNSHTDGRQTTYWPNGQLQEEYFEKNHRSYNTHKTWNEQGNQVSYSEYSQPGKYKVHKDWDDQGNLTRHWEIINGVEMKIID